MMVGPRDPRLTPQQLRNRLALAALSVIMVLAFASMGAQAGARGSRLPARTKRSRS